MPLPYAREARHSADAIGQIFPAAWARSDQIFEFVGPGQMRTAPIIWRHPFIFYLGHLPAFSWNQICGGLLHWKSHNPYFDALFCRGIDPDADTGGCHWHPELPDEWPSLEQTTAYR